MNFITTSWVDFPEGTHADGQVFAIADVHGRADLLDALLGEIRQLPDLGGNDRRLVFLGDLINRGPRSLRCLDLAWNARLGEHPAIVLPGNHEAMLVDALTLPIETGALMDWINAGGFSMIRELKGPTGNLIETITTLQKALPEDFAQRYRRAPSHFRSGDLLFVHAGIMPPIGPWQRDGALEAFLALPLAEQGSHHWAWIRQPFINWTGKWSADGRMVVVHGHTIEHPDLIEDPQDLLRAVDKVASKRRINLDCGAFCNGQLTCLEAIEGRYRFHAMIAGERQVFP